MELNNIKSSKINWGDAANDLNQNFGKINNAIEQVKNVTTRNKGYFSSSDKLLEAYPSAHEGDIAYVKRSGYTPFERWRWNGAAWEGTGESGGNDNVSLGDYYTQAEIDGKFTNQDEKLSELGSKTDAIKAKIGDVLSASISYIVEKDINKSIDFYAMDFAGKKVTIKASDTNSAIQSLYIYQITERGYILLGILQVDNTEQSFIVANDILSDRLVFQNKDKDWTINGLVEINLKYEGVAEQIVELDTSIQELESKTSIQLATAISGALNIDTVNRIVSVTGPLFINIGGKEIQVDGGDFVVSHHYSAFVYNTVKKELELVDYPKLGSNHLCLCVFDMSGRVYCSALNPVKVNDKLPSYVTDDYFQDLICPFIEGFGVNNDGLIVISSNECCTPYINIYGQKYLYTKSNAVLKCAFLDKEYNLIEVFQPELGYVQHQIPESAYYFVLSANKIYSRVGVISFNPINRVSRIDGILDSIVKKNARIGEVIADSSMLDINNIDDSNPPTKPTSQGGWDWQSAFLLSNGNLTYYTSEIQTRLIPVIGGATYIYNGKFSGNSCIGFYGEDESFLSGIPARYFSDGAATTVEFTVPIGARYASFNCFKNSIEKFCVYVKEEYVGIETRMSISGSKKESAIGNYIDTKKGNKHIAISQHFSENVCNSVGEHILAKIICNNNAEYDVVYRHNGALDSTLPQKENTANQNDIMNVEFPMAVFEDYFVLKNRSGDVSKILANGRERLAFVRTVPAFTIRFNPKDGGLLEYKDLRLYIGKNELNVVNHITIKNGQTVVFTKGVNADDDISNVFSELKAELSDINGLSFELVFGDIENLSVKDIVATKEEGLPFVYTYSSDCTTNGEMLYDNCPVFVEGLYNEPFELEIVENNNVTRIFLEGDFFFTIPNGFERVRIQNDGLVLDYIECDENYNKADSKRPVIKGLTCHDMSTEPSSTSANATNKIGNIIHIGKSMKRKGWTNISVRDVIKYMKDANHPMPRKGWFLEIDDFGARADVTDILSEKEKFLRQLELLKMEDIKVCFACHLEKDAELFLKIKNGTASVEEQQKLTTYMSNDMVYRMRGLMSSMDVTMSLHSLIYPVQTVTASSFDDVLQSLRNSIWWFERIYNVTPMSYVTHGTGNSSPYYRRIMQMYGMQAVGQDNASWYSQGRRCAFYNRNGIYYRKGDFLDNAY